MRVGVICTGRYGFSAHVPWRQVYYGKAVFFAFGFAVHELSLSVSQLTLSVTVLIRYGFAEALLAFKALPIAFQESGIALLYGFRRVNTCICSVYCLVIL